MRLILSFALFSLLLACANVDRSAYFDRGSPESLLDVSSEVVNLSVQDSSALDELSAWINQDQPTRAELYCMQGDSLCAQAQEILDLYGVPTLTVTAADNSVALVYERVLARDCENRFIDNSINPYNLNHPTFGCSTAANMVQMVSDKQQFVSPNLLDPQDAFKANQAYQIYQQPPNREARSGLGESLSDNINFQ